MFWEQEDVLRARGGAKEETCVALRRPRLALDECCLECRQSDGARRDTLRTPRAHGDGPRRGERLGEEALGRSRLAVGDVGA